MKKITRYLVIFAACFATIACSKHRESSYILEQEVVFSRHNIRSPLSSRGSILAEVTPHEWVEWGVPAANLTERGGRMEEKMGAYFYSTLSESLGPFNDTGTFFYSNSRQRTKATATHFINGFQPGLTLHYLTEEDTMDPVFTPKFTVMNDAIHERIIAEMNELGGAAGTAEDPYKGIRMAINALVEDIRFMEEMIDFSSSDFAKKNGVEHLPMESLSITTNLDDEAHFVGDYNNINSIADALVLQYYETGFEFGKQVSEQDVRRIGNVKTVYDEMLFSVPTSATLISYPLVKYIRDELTGGEHSFTFLCGHDSNITSISSALGFEMPETVSAVEHKSPIGSKIVFRKYRKGKKLFVDINLVYASVSQLREITDINADTAPVTLSIGLEGLQRNSDGYYAYEDVIARFDSTIARYEELCKLQ